MHDLSFILQTITANLSQSMSVKEFLKSVDIWWRYKQKFGGMFFLTHGV